MTQPEETNTPGGPKEIDIGDLVEGLKEPFLAEGRTDEQAERGANLILAVVQSAPDMPLHDIPTNPVEPGKERRPKSGKGI